MKLLHPDIPICKVGSLSFSIQGMQTKMSRPLSWRVSCFPFVTWALDETELTFMEFLTGVVSFQMLIIMQALRFCFRDGKTKIQKLVLQLVQTRAQICN